MQRIWEPYLTQSDRAHLALRPRMPVPLGQRPALLLVDLYRNVFGDEPEPLLDAVREWPNSCGLAAWEALEPTLTLLRWFRAHDYPVAHCTGLPEETTGITNWSFIRSPGGWDDASGQRGWEGMRKRSSMLAGQLARMSDEERGRFERRYEIIEPARPLPGELVVHKSAPSAFWNTPLAAQLAAMEVDTLVVVGESTSGCVRASVVDAASERLPVVVAEDCVFDRHEATHALNLFDMHQKYAEVMSSVDVLAYLDGLEHRRD